MNPLNIISRIKGHRLNLVIALTAAAEIAAIEAWFIMNVILGKNMGAAYNTLVLVLLLSIVALILLAVRIESQTESFLKDIADTLKGKDAHINWLRKGLAGPCKRLYYKKIRKVKK